MKVFVTKSVHHLKGWRAIGVAGDLNVRSTNAQSNCRMVD